MGPGGDRKWPGWGSRGIPPAATKGGHRALDHLPTHCPSSDGENASLNSVTRAGCQTAGNAPAADRMSNRGAERADLMSQDVTLHTRKIAPSSASPNAIESSAVPTMACLVLPPRWAELVAAQSGPALMSQMAFCDTGQIPDTSRKLDAESDPKVNVGRPQQCP